MSEPCIHELPRGQCSYCRELPFGINKMVHRTGFGNAFHNWPNCEYLESGQKFAESRGKEISDVVTVSWSEVSQKLYPCEWCCALYYSQGKNLMDCLVDNGHDLRPGKIVADRYLGRNMKEYQIYYPESGEIEITTDRYVKKIK